METLSVSRGFFEHSIPLGCGLLPFISELVLLFQADSGTNAARALLSDLPLVFPPFSCRRIVVEGVGR